MGGSGSNYDKDNKLSKEDIKKKVKKQDSDAYLFDVEYEKLKKEREEAQAKYADARDRYLRVTEQLRDEMANGTASDTDMARFMAVLTDRGIELQEQQAQIQKELDSVGEQVASVESRIEELRQNAFSGSTHAYQPINKEEEYKGFRNEERGEAKVVEMRPEEYLRRVAYDFTGNGMQNLLNGVSAASVERYMRAMARGTKYKSPSLNYKGSKASGTERALAALMNGYSKIPVMIIE